MSADVGVVREEWVSRGKLLGKRLTGCSSADGHARFSSRVS